MKEKLGVCVETEKIFLQLFDQFIQQNADQDSHFTSIAVCLSNRIKMSKSDMYMSSFHIYVQIVIFMSKLQYIYPNGNIYASKTQVLCMSTVRFIYNFIHFLTYLRTVRLWICSGRILLSCLYHKFARFLIRLPVTVSNRLNARH